MAARAVKVAISLPADLLEAAEREREARGETRSQFFRNAVVELLKREREREAEELYIRGYVEQPETEEEMAWVVAASLDAWAENPWDEKG